jgi:hypothetical protein
MPYVYSTLAAPQEYTEWQRKEDGKNVELRSVHIEGGHGIMNRNFLTPQGVATQVSADDLTFLNGIHAFNEHVRLGFIAIEGKKSEESKVVRDMTPRDGSAQITPDDYVKQGKKPPKVGLPNGEDE